MWNQPPEHVPFDPILITLAEVIYLNYKLIHNFYKFKFFLQGLRETSHPFNFVAQAGFRDLLETHDADDKAIQVLPKLIQPIKNAMVNIL